MLKLHQHQPIQFQQQLYTHNNNNSSQNLQRQHQQQSDNLPTSSTSLQYQQQQQQQHIHFRNQQQQSTSIRQCMWMMFILYFVIGVILIGLSLSIYAGKHHNDIINKKDIVINNKDIVTDNKDIKNNPVIQQKQQTITKTLTTTTDNKNNIKKQQQSIQSTNDNRYKQQQSADSIKNINKYTSEQVKTLSYEHLITPNHKQILDITLSEEQLNTVIYSMQYPKTRPSHIKTKKSLKHIQDIYFAYTLSQFPDRSQYLQAQYYYYNNKYQIGSYSKQLHLCIVMVGHNNANNYYKLYDSLSKQNYTNYHVVHIDDNSNDNTIELIQKYLYNQQKLRSKVILIQQNVNKFSLENRDVGISNYCQDQDIVVDIDADDWFIGRQVLQLVNSLYQKYGSDEQDYDINQNNQDDNLNKQNRENDNVKKKREDNTDKSNVCSQEQLWLLYLNNIIYYPASKSPLANSDGQIDPSLLTQQKKYRTSDVWRTTQLRTFKKQLYNKIDKSDFKDKFGNYHRQKSDAFIHFALVQLAAPKHMKIYDQFVYFYQSSFAGASMLRKFSRLASKVLTPYQSLKSLNDKTKRVEGYSPPEKLYKQFKEAEKQYFQQK